MEERPFATRLGEQGWWSVHVMVVTIQIRPGKMAGAFRLYSSATGGANDTLSTTFANLDASLSATFDALITKTPGAPSLQLGQALDLRRAGF